MVSALYYGQNAELNFYSASSLKQHSVDRHVAPLKHIILNTACFSREAANTNFAVFGLTRPGLYLPHSRGAC